MMPERVWLFRVGGEDAVLEVGRVVPGPMQEEAEYLLESTVTARIAELELAEANAMDDIVELSRERKGLRERVAELERERDAWRTLAAQGAGDDICGWCERGPGWQDRVRALLAATASPPNPKEGS